MSQKIENQLNLALDITEEERQKRQNNSEHRGRVEGKNKKKSIRNVHSKKNRK